MKINNISGGYPGAFTLNNISFTIEEGKMYALLGLNGCGKTTLIKMILGILKAKSGSIFVEDRDILTTKEKDRARLISYVPQYSNIPFDTSVIDVVLMGITPYLKIFETPSNAHIKQAYTCLEEFGIAHLADLNYQSLSGGQKQMVIIARALLQNGRYMILDEPESSLDLINKNEFMKKIKQINKTYNKGCIISMHSPEYALNYCDHILLLRDGKITEIDIAKEDIQSIERQLAVIYGDIKIINYQEKFFIYYE